MAQSFAPGVKVRHRARDVVMTVVSTGRDGKVTCKRLDAKGKGWITEAFSPGELAEVEVSIE